mgnify:CR=1 FL=1
MKLMHDFISCYAMKVVDILCDDAFQFPFFFPFRQDIMTRVRLYLVVVEEVEENLFYHFPRFFGVTIIIVDIQRLGIVFVPYSVLAPERRNAALCRDACSRESNYLLRLRNNLGCFC